MNRIAHAFREWFAPFVPPQAHRLPLLWAFATGVVAYGIFIFHHLLHDHRPRMPWIEQGIYWDFGRWFTVPLLWLGYFADIPVLNPLLAVFFLTMAGYYAATCFETGSEGKFEKFLLPALVAVFPANLALFFFTPFTMLTAASILFAVAAVCYCRQGTLAGGVLGFVFLMLMWTTYQASIGVFLMVAGAFFIAQLLKDSQGSHSTGGAAFLFKPLLAMAVTLVASTAVYAIFFKLLSRGIGHASSISLQELPALWMAAGRSAFHHLLLTQPDLPKPIKVLTLAVVCLAFLGSLWACRRSWSRVLFLFVLWPCSLLATKGVFFLIKAQFPFYEYRMNAALGFFYAFSFWVLLFLARRTKWMYVLCALLACFTLLRFVQADLVRQIVNKRGETHDLALANRLLTRIEALKGLDASKKYQLVRIGNYPWYRRGLMTAGGRKYDVGGDSHMDLGFLTAHWIPHEVFNYLGSRVQLLHDDYPGQKRLEFAKRFLLQNRKPYPAESSVFLFGDTIFVYLSPIPATEKPKLSPPTVSTTPDFEKISANTWRFEKLEDTTTDSSWRAISQERQTKNKTFNGSLKITSDRNLKIQALLRNHNAVYEGTAVNYSLKANEPLEINMLYRFKADFPTIMLQLKITEAPQQPVELKMENLRIVEYP